MLFLCCVYVVAISGCSAFVLPEVFSDRLDSVIVNMLLGAMKRQAVIAAEGGRARAMPSREVLPCWDTSPTAVEHHLQRARWIRAVSRGPANREQVLMGVFGATRLGACVKRRR
eukprot:606136-Pyramimonas_sp.AAC.1